MCFKTKRLGMMDYKCATQTICWHIELCEARRRDIVKLPINSMCLVDMEKTGINRRIDIFRKRGDMCVCMCLLVCILYVYNLKFPPRV